MSGFSRTETVRLKADTTSTRSIRQFDGELEDSPLRVVMSSFDAQGNDWIDAEGTARRYVTREQRRGGKAR